MDDYVRRPLAVVTGASSGIGAAFAEKLALAGMDLILVARRAERLNATKERLERDRSVSVRVVAADLTDPKALRSIEQELAALERVDLLVNSAGFGICEAFADANAERVERELYLDLIVPARLCRAVLPNMLARGRGAIINVSSMAAYLPIPRFATYCAAKAALLRFTQALHGEVGGRGVRIQALCPGPVDTEFFDISGYRLEDVPRPMRQTAEACVESSLRALKRGKVVHIPHPLIRLFVASMGLFPTRLKVRILGGGTDWWIQKNPVEQQ